MLEQGMKPESRSPPPSRTSALNFAAMSPRGYKLMIHSMSTRANFAAARVFYTVYTGCTRRWILKGPSVTKVGIISLWQKLRFPRPDECEIDEARRERTRKTLFERKEENAIFFPPSLARTNGAINWWEKGVLRISRRFIKKLIGKISPRLRN